MKKTVSVLLVFLFAASLYGCFSEGISHENYSSAIMERDDLLKKVDELQIELSKAEKVSDENESRAKADESAIEESSEVLGLKSRINELNEQIDKKQSESKKVSDEIALKQSESKKADREIASKQSESKKLDTEIAEKQNELDALNKKIEPIKKEELRKLTEGVTVYEDKYVKINYLCVEDNSTSYYNIHSVVFQVENKTDVILTIQSDAIALDGVTIDGAGSGSDEIAPQSRGKARINYDNISNKSPSYISGNLTIIDFSESVIKIPYSPGSNYFTHSYEATFVNIPLK